MLSYSDGKNWDYTEKLKSDIVSEESIKQFVWSGFSFEVKADRLETSKVLISLALPPSKGLWLKLWSSSKTFSPSF
jgi:hypothetical protein